MRPYQIVICIVLFLLRSADAQPLPHPTHPSILSVVQQISADTLFASITRLTQFHTRHTFSDTTSDSVGIGAAVRWVLAKGEGYDSSNRYTWEQFPWTGNFQGGPVTRNNLIARIAGSAPEPARYFVGGHLDSRTVNGSDNTSYAPGADDNGSSCAAFLELLRILPDTLRHDLEVIWFTGEEQGLWGSEAYAQFLSQQGARVDAMIAMDMISHIALPTGEIDSNSVRLYASGNFNEGGTASSSRNLQRYMKWVGEAYADLDSFEMRTIPAVDRPGRGSDHISFSDVGYPAIRVIERNEDLAYQHTPNDLPQHLSPTYAKRVAMTSFGALLTMLQAPDRPSPLLVEQTAAEQMRVTIPDTVALPEGGRFYVTKRNYTHEYFDEIVDIGSQRQHDFAITADVPGTTYAFSACRADSLNLPSPFSDETVLSVLSVSDRQIPIPGRSAITASPNPFNASIDFRLTIATRGPVTLTVVDLLGRRVAEILNETVPAGVRHVVWTPQNVASGFYVARLRTADAAHAVRIALIK